MNIPNIASINNIMLPTVRSFKILPRYNGYGFIFESFALN